MSNSETVMAEARSRSLERHVAKVPAAPSGSAMPVGPKTITDCRDASSSGQRRARYAVALAQRWGSHIIGMHVVFPGVKLPRSMDYARGEKAIRAVIAHEQRLNAAAEATAAVVGDH